MYGMVSYQPAIYVCHTGCNQKQFAVAGIPAAYSTQSIDQQQKGIGTDQYQAASTIRDTVAGFTCDDVVSND